LAGSVARSSGNAVAGEVGGAVSVPGSSDFLNGPPSVEHDVI
jgi:hypothetical protein